MKGYHNVPLYERLARTINTKIHNGIWKPGTCIPSERELIRTYHVSRITVRKAVDVLARQGKLDKRQGKGTFVSIGGMMKKSDNGYSFIKEMGKQGRISSILFVEKTIISADHNIADNLKIAVGDKVVDLKQLYIDKQGNPIMLEHRYEAADRRLVVGKSDEKHPTLHSISEDIYDGDINMGKETLKVCMLDAISCKLLHGADKQVGFTVKRTLYANDRIIYYSLFVSKADLYDFTVQYIASPNRVNHCASDY